MKRIKRLSLACASVAVLVAVAAGSASAASFISEKPATTYSATSTTKHYFFEAPGLLECAQSSFSGEGTEAKMPSISVAPSYSKCEAAHSLTMTVKPNGCRYRFYPGTEITSGKFAGQFGGSMNVECPPLAKMEVTLGFFCRPYLIGSQLNLSQVRYKNIGGGVEAKIEVIAAIENLNYYEPNGQASCEEQHSMVGEYQGAWLVKGNATSGGAPVGIHVG